MNSNHPLYDFSTLLNSLNIEEILFYEKMNKSMEEKNELFFIFPCLFLCLLIPAIAVVYFLPPMDVGLKFLLAMPMAAALGRGVCFLIEKNISPLNLISSYKKNKQKHALLKNASLQQLNKKFMFDLFLSLDKFKPFSITGDKNSIFKKNLENAFSKEDYSLILNLLLHFKKYEFDKFNNVIKDVIHKEKTQHELRLYKKEMNDEEEMEINFSPNKIINSL